MGGPLSYSQAWKTSVCSRDANCLQPDTFLDLAERVEMRVKPLEAPPIPTSAGSKCTSAPILWALSPLFPGHLSLVVCGRESAWLLGCRQKATSWGCSSGWSPGPLKRRLQIEGGGGLRNPCPVLGDKQENVLLTLQGCQVPCTLQRQPRLTPTSWRTTSLVSPQPSTSP